MGIISIFHKHVLVQRELVEKIVVGLPVGRWVRLLVQLPGLLRVSLLSSEHARVGRGISVPGTARLLIEAELPG